LQGTSWARSDVGGSRSSFVDLNWSAASTPACRRHDTESFNLEFVNHCHPKRMLEHPTLSRNLFPKASTLKLNVPRRMSGNIRVTKTMRRTRTRMMTRPWSLERTTWDRMTVRKTLGTLSRLHRMRRCSYCTSIMYFISHW